MFKLFVDTSYGYFSFQLTTMHIGTNVWIDCKIELNLSAKENWENQAFEFMATVGFIHFSTFYLPSLQEFPGRPS
jgi:hypothetical protein